MIRLNLCCGTNVFPNWINIDKTDVDADYLRHMREAHPDFRWPDAQQPIADAVLAGKLEFRRHDVRQGLPFADASVDAIYIGQAIEHFNRGTEAPRLLRECARVLRSGGRIKLTTPDLHRMLQVLGEDEMFLFEREQPDFYREAFPEDQLSYLLFGAMGPSSTNESYEGHHHCYTKRSLGALLTQCGIDPHPDSGPRFADTLDKGMSHSFAIEGVKP